MTAKQVSWSLLILMTLLGGCDKRPKGTLSENDMVDLLTDIELAHAYRSVSGVSPDRKEKEALTAAVLAKHNVSQEQLDSSVAYYGRNIDEYYKLYQQVENNLRARSGRLEEAISEDDIWPYSRFAAFMKGQISDGIVFSFPADNIDPGSSLDWKMHLSSHEAVEAILGVEYDNGTTSIARTKTLANNNSLSVSLTTDTAYVAKRIFGSAFVSGNAAPLWADSIKLLKNEYDSLNYLRTRHQKRIYPVSAKREKEDTTSVKDMERTVVTQAVDRQPHF